MLLRGRDWDLWRDGDGVMQLGNSYRVGVMPDSHWTRQSIMSEVVQLSLKDGPITIKNHNGSEIDHTYQLWDGISTREFYPAVVAGGAYYVLTVMKHAAKAEEVSGIEIELIDALLKLASASVFSGGSHMHVETRKVVTSPRFDSNAASVRDRLLAGAGQRLVSATITVPTEFGATYSQPPLTLAVKITHLMHADFFVNRLIGYYQRAAIERGVTPTWCVELYKVRDLIKKKYRGEKTARSNLNIKGTEWRCFGDLLNNNDLRHAEVSGAAPVIPSPEIEWLYSTARSWVARYLTTCGVNAVG